MTLLQFDFDKVDATPGALQKLQEVNDPSMLKDIPGVRMVTTPVVTVEFGSSAGLPLRKARRRRVIFSSTRGMTRALPSTQEARAPSRPGMPSMLNTSRRRMVLGLSAVARRLRR